MDDAYAVQRAWVARKMLAGGRRVGYKIGFTNRQVHRELGVDRPAFGTLFAASLFDNGSTISAERFLAPRIEAELAFVIRDRIAGPVSELNAILPAVEKVLPALEISDGRVAPVASAGGDKRTALDIVADNAGTAGVILGGSGAAIDSVDLRWIHAILLHNGVIEDSGVAAQVLGHPARGLIALVNALADRGEALLPGDVVITGAFTRSFPIVAGDVVHADYHHFGSVSAQFN